MTQFDNEDSDYASFLRDEAKRYNTPEPYYAKVLVLVQQALDRAQEAVAIAKESKQVCQESLRNSRETLELTKLFKER
jgi:hypothetical protein